MRDRFRDWGADLSDADFACALAAAGALGTSRFPRNVDPKPELFASVILRQMSFEGILPWYLGRIPPQLGAELLLQAWRSFLGLVRPGSFRIQVLESEADPRWLLEQLSRPEVGAAAVEQRPRTRASREGTRGRGPEAYSVGEEGPDEGYRSAYSYGTEVAERSRSRRWKDAEPQVEMEWTRRGGRSLGREEILEAAQKGFERVMDERREQAPPRWLQARLRRGSRDVKTLREGGSYEAVIRIGQADAQWVSVAQPFPTPEEPPRPEGHWLTVIFWEPRVSPAPQVRPLLLPPEGNTEELAFAFAVPAGLDRIAARVTVLHANRVLQTGLLRAAVGGRKPWTFTLDATPRTRLEGLSARSEFDLALVLNHDDEGAAHMTAAAGDQAVVLKLDDGPLEALTEFLNHQISAIADDPQRYEGLESPGTLELFRALAVMGATLYDVLCNRQRLSRLEDARRIHITSARAESFFPIELLYRFRPPSKTAGLCPHAAAALDSGDCAADCSSDKRQTVCPLGFLGLSRVIERHGHEPEDGERISGDFELRAEPVRKQSVLPVSRTALLAASDRANEADANAVGSLLQKLRQRGPAEQAADWAEWERHVASDLPGLLVLLPHHERKGGFDVLEIGDGEQLESAAIWDEQVRRQPDGPHPLVLLLGCATNLTRVSFDNPAGRFHDKGAAVVVSTIATILGRHASPATALLVELLDEMAAAGDRTLGDVMLRLRQKLVAKQTPMALGLTAYGDADWILTRTG